MFIHTRKSSRRARAVILGVATALMFGTGARGADPVARLVLVAYGNETGGRALADGEYDAAERILTEAHSWLSTDAGTLDTNRCVAYAMIHQFSAAHAACNAAIKGVEQEPVGFWVPGTESGRRHDAAVAYSNRAVLQWLSGNMAAAEQDLAKAKRLAPEADFVARNLTALHEHTTATAAAVASESAAPLQ
jgi:Flp pilus assembly protein TadD